MSKAVFIACFPSNNHNNLLYINIRRVNHVKRNNNLLYKCSLSGFILSSNTFQLQFKFLIRNTSSIACLCYKANVN